MYIATLSLASVGVTIGTRAISPALPELQRVLDLSNGQIGWIVSVYVLPGVILAVPMGILAEVVGKRRLFSTALIAYGLAGLVQGIFMSYPLLLIMRAIQGICFSAAMPLTITLLGDSFSGRERVRAIAARSTVLTSGAVVLPIGGALLAEVSWRAPLLLQMVTIPIGLHAFRIVEGGKVLLGAKGRYAHDLYKVLREQPGMFAVMLTAFIRYFFNFSLLAYLPIMLVNHRGTSLTEVGLVISLLYLAAVISTTVAPALLRRTPASVVAIVSVAAMGTLTAAFSVVPGWKWALVVGLMFGVADGIFVVLQDAYTIHTAQSHVRAGVVSVSQTIRNLGKLAGPLAMSLIAAVSSIKAAFIVVAILGMVTLPLLLPLRRMDQELRHPNLDSTADGAPVVSTDDLPYE